MLVPFGSFGNPLLQEISFRFGHCAMYFRRWHHFIRIFRKYASHKFTLIRFAWHDGYRTRVEFADGAVAIIQAQPRLNLLAIGTVTEETFVRKDRPHIAIEVHPLGGLSRNKPQHAGHHPERPRPRGATARLE